ncbi:alpha/beta hydrolase [Pyxidicoccus fallax]|uniref:Alpha/beta hydrolase n=1 Tax=Pyxidicoccus fallax TaxID=394095 RepID=A0A848LI17_9BACT|nr:alpha/beta hydrolase [Pyxidicoccus fallax]NMO17058.1 alpha/beta hydrolase [Pyxidicoccus fallax]NPC83370.1 alpha/beta hydrolase [Pyxidicoccus fallax]
MYLAIGVLAGTIILVLAMRQWLLHRECEPSKSEPFDGVVYQVGKAAIAERRSDNPRATVICMHGFVADMRYFTDHYSDPDLQLILLTSCDYHVPISNPRHASVPWAKVPTEREGTIPYDAAVLIQALEHLPKTDTIRVHGHSRGGAVILEAASMRPDLFQRVEVVLEAPVLPQARPYVSTTAAQLWLLSFVIPLWRKQPINPRNLKTWGPLENNPRKRELIMAFPFNPKRVATMVSNLRGIDDWMHERDASLFKNVPNATVIVPGKDRVLDSQSMLESARKAGPSLNVVTVDGCSHFPIWDRPDVLPTLARATERPAARG